MLRRVTILVGVVTTLGLASNRMAQAGTSLNGSGSTFQKAYQEVATLVSEDVL